MGSYITLDIGKLEVDWGKNSNFFDHSPLFRPSDVKEIPYLYANDVVIEQEGYARKLSRISRRFDLLGYDCVSAESMYKRAALEYMDSGFSITLPFEAYRNAVKKIDISNPDMSKMENVDFSDRRNLGLYVAKCVLDQPDVRSLPCAEVIAGREVRGTPRDATEYFLQCLNPYIILRLLADNPANADVELYWYYYDVVHNGWVEREQIVKELAPENKILLVTEGTSDALVLRKSIEELYPDISDFFEFIDVTEKFPFTGTGNLYNFCVALCQIKIQNQVMVVFDNDTAGIEKYRKALELVRPKSFMITRLPDHADFSDFPTIGPHGESADNINGRAVAIECFLDLCSTELLPRVRWGSYNKGEQKYQGELEGKDEYVRAFKSASLTSGDYDTTKLKYLVDWLISEWLHRIKR